MKKIPKLETVIFDMDGTALNNEKEMDKLLVKYHREIKAAGVKLMVASGRLDYMVFNYMNELELDTPIIGSNGATITYMDHKREPIVINRLEMPLLREMIEMARERETIFHIFTTDGLIGLKNEGRLAYYYDSNESKKVEEEVPIYIGEEYLTDEYLKDAVKMLLVTEDEATIADFQAFAEKHGLTAAKSGDDLFDIMPQGISKGSAIETLVEKGIIDLETTLVFGDNYNDLEMLQAAKYPIVMENAHDDIKAYAYDICPTNETSGVGQYVLNTLGIDFEF